MINVEIILTFIIISIIIVILDYFLTPKSLTPLINGATINIRDSNNKVPDDLWYSDNQVAKTYIPEGLIYPIVLHSNTLKIGIGMDNVEELSLTEMPNDCFIETVNIIIDNSNQGNCNDVWLKGNIVTITNTVGLTVRDVNTQNNPRPINSNNYSACYAMSNQCAMLDFTWPNVGSVGLKIKKRVRNSNTQINIVLTDVNPMINTNSFPSSQPTGPNTTTNP